MEILIVFRHGLGDAVQLTPVLRHLQKYRTDWTVDILCTYGKHSCFTGLCHGLFVVHNEDALKAKHSQIKDNYNHVFNLDWWECKKAYANCPSTKTEQALIDAFAINPDPELWQYTIKPTEDAEKRAEDYLLGICDRGTYSVAKKACKFNAVIIHYQGNTSESLKNLPHETAKAICDIVIKADLVPVILDWETPLRSPLPDNKTIFNPGVNDPLWGGQGTGDAVTLAALIEQSTLFIGVDSGPLHVAASTTTPTIAIWLKMHPIHFLSPAPNVLNLMPVNHEQYAAGKEALNFFAKHYRFQEYQRLESGIVTALSNRLLGTTIQESLNELRSKSYGYDYYREHKEAGLDYMVCGDWQRRYGRWMVAALGVKDKRLLDIGCACGAIVRGFGEAGAITHGVDVNEYMISLAKRTYPDMEPVLSVCDCVNLHLFDNESWDALHSAQVAEHWKPELVPFVLRELHRVTKPGGLFFCALDTEESFARQGRTMEHEDPTHICVRPMAWWYGLLDETGWDLVSDQERKAFVEAPESFIPEYDWDWFLVRRK